jgi:hypothetical protein
MFCCQLIVQNDKRKIVNFSVFIALLLTDRGLLLCWYFMMSCPEPLLIEKLMMKITTKADRIPSAGY